MPQPCRTCRHPRRVEIDKLLVQGMAPKTISRRAGMPSYDSIIRHKRARHHETPGTLLQVASSLVLDKRPLAEVELEARTTWLLELRSDLRLMRDIRAKLYQNGQLTAAAQVQPAITKLMQLQAAYLGELKAATSRVEHHHLVRDPGWEPLVHGLIALRRRYPEAREDLDRLLRELEAAALPDRVIDGHAERLVT